ncbi:MAG TPA: hypothetical protein DCF44_05735 [Chitinophagaceae bacterium]|nr:hypothetical protein [Chitinophagaceae bacterium]
MKQFFWLSTLFACFSTFFIFCKKDTVVENLSNSKAEHSNSLIAEERDEVHYYYIDGVSATQTSYETKLSQTGVYEHIIFDPTSSENVYSHYVFSTKAGYILWGDALGFKISKAIYVADRLAFVADSAGLNQIDSTSTDTIPLWYDNFKKNLIKKELDDSNSPDFVCYAVYFWQGYTQANLPAHVKVGGNVVSEPRILWNNNKLSSWKPDIMDCLSDYRYAHLNAWDKWHYVKPIPNPIAPFPTTITVKGNVFTPFLNIYAPWDNKISSYTSWETQ